MEKQNLLYIIIIATIIITRISIFLIPEVDIQFFNITIHHFWFGIILTLIAIAIPKGKAKLWILGIGLGLTIDQLIFMLLGTGMDKEYWALPSTIGTIIIASLLFPFRKKIIK